MSIEKYSLETGRSRKLFFSLGIMVIASLLPMQAMAQSATPEPESAALSEAEALKLFTRGEKLFSRCVRCHTTGLGEPSELGPNLHGIIGAKAGQVEGFEYSESLLNSDVVWDDESLHVYLRRPKNLIPKTNMVFFGMRKEADRQAMIHYLKQVTQ